MKSNNHSLMKLFEQQSELAKFCLDQAAFCFFGFDADGYYLYANPQACRSLGYSLSELLERNVSDIVPTIPRHKWRELWHKVRNQGSVTVEAVQRRQDGTQFPVEVTINSLEFEGEPFSIAFAQNISERKRVEEALRLTQFSFDKASIGIFRTGYDGRILDVNEHACSRLGYTRAELSGMTIFDIDPVINPADRRIIWQTLSRDQVSILESVHRHKDGTTFPVEITSNYLEYEGARYSISYVRDISAQKREEARRATLEAHFRQAQRMEALGTLAGSIAHDFNNILSAISGYAELAKCVSEDNRKAQQYLFHLCEASSRAKHLVQQILSFSRQSNSDRIPVDISAVVMEAIKLIEATLPPSIRLSHDIGKDLGIVFADETQIHQVVMNLCTNAHQAMKHDGGLLEISLVPTMISTQDLANHPDLNPGKYLNLIIADTGHGMDRKTMENIFDPYFTTKKDEEGTGLGLSIVHGIVKEHGGGIKTLSEPGFGTVFQILLPVLEADAGAATETGEWFPRGEECILYVDDEELLLEIGKEMLGGLGYAVETRASSIDALEAFRANPQKYDLVISDLTMPGMTGEKLSARIKEIRADIPIMLYTGFSTSLTRGRLAAIGISAVLMKPVTLHELATGVRTVLDEARVAAAPETLPPGMRKEI